MNIKKQRLMLLLTILCGSYSAYAALYNEADKEQQDELFNMPSLLQQPQEFEQEKARQQLGENYRQILQLIKQNKWDEAKQKLANLIQDDPKQAIYYNLKALLAILDKQPDEAEKYYQKALSVKSDNAQALVGLAKLKLDSKQYDQAKRYIQQAQKIQPKALIIYQVLADIALQQEGLKAAEKVLLNAKQTLKDNTDAQVEIGQMLGRMYLTEKKPDKVESLATDLVKRYPENLAALSFLAEAQVVNQHLAAAEQTLRQIIAKHPKDVKHRFLLARLLSQQNDKADEVTALLDEAASNLKNPNLILAYKTAFLLKQKQFDQALFIAQQVKEQSPDISVGNILLGNVYVAQKKYQQALKNYQRAYQISPAIKILDRIVSIYSLQHKPDEAISFLKSELDKYPDNGQIRFRLANAYQKAEKYDQAGQYYQALLVKQPDNPIILNNLAWSLYQQGNAKALGFAKKAYEKAPDSVAIADTYGVILLKYGDKQQALKILKQVAAKSSMPEIQLHLTEAYYANGNRETAIKILQELVNTYGSELPEAIGHLQEWQ
ncbi:tetratricopeptide repeat protein [methane-oxidizing endosymbiont of Gigantopelta aegis]|uniref:tetratricopeptide repeat protein n=1 Tax=methane-oxidizing endosymbiont of Gigantopelta aegis TaxID=2794938 RepID=UPI001BE4912A|nr:tetratricopeptide repeat protein [methane-oxidizing endosymbiont of Gigantopelta aegis]